MRLPARHHGAIRPAMPLGMGATSARRAPSPRDGVDTGWVGDSPTAPRPQAPGRWRVPQAPETRTLRVDNHPVSRARTRLASSDVRSYHAAADAAASAASTGRDIHGKKLTRTERRAARSRARAARHSNHRSAR